MKARHRQTRKALPLQKSEEMISPFYMSFSDLMVIICSFFLLLLSMSKIETGNFEKMKAEFTGSSQNSLMELATNLQELSKTLPDVNISRDSDGVRINLMTAAFFERASSEIKPGALKPLTPLLNRLLKSKYKIAIEGHTDDENYYRFVNGQWETNWTLSGARAGQVVGHLIAFGFQENRLTIIGHAANHPQIDYKNKKGMALEKARAKNRRVSILVY